MLDSARSVTPPLNSSRVAIASLMEISSFSYSGCGSTAAVSCLGCMETALKRVVEERSLLTEENQRLCQQLRLAAEGFAESERTWRQELRKACDQLRSATEESHRLRRKLSGLRRRSEVARQGEETLRAELQAAQEQLRQQSSELRERSDLVRRLELDGELERSRLTAANERLEREAGRREELVQQLQSELQQLKLRVMSEHVPVREYERLMAQHEKLVAHSQSLMVPLDQHNKLLEDLRAAQEAVREYVPKSEYLAVVEKNQTLVERQFTDFVPRERYEDLERDLANLKSRAASESVPMSRWNNLVALNKKLLRRIEEECISLERYERMTEEMNRLSEDRGLLEESARVLEEEKEELLLRLAEKTRELEHATAILLSTQKDYSSLSALVPESNATIESLREEAHSWQRQLVDQRELTMQKEAEKSVLLVQLSELKLKLKQVSGKRNDAETQVRNAEIEAAHLRGLLDGANDRIKELESRSSRLELEVENFLQRDRSRSVFDSHSPPISPLRPTQTKNYSGISFSVGDNDTSITLTPIKSLDERIREYQELTLAREESELVK